MGRSRSAPGSVLRDPLASFILTVGAVDMVIGGLGDRSSLFLLGLATVGAAAWLGWRRAQARARRAAFWQARHRQQAPHPEQPFSLAGATAGRSNRPPRQSSLGEPLRLPPPRRPRQRRIY